jgi:large-conductance mechanosensitive channel
MKKSSEKSFGVLFFGLFLIIGLWPLLNSAEIRVWSIMLSFAFLILAYLQPKLLKPLNRTWIKLGEILGRIIAPIIMALIFFTIVTPISLLVRVLGKDLLRLKFSKNDTYWIKRVKNITTMDKQF